MATSRLFYCIICDQTFAYDDEKAKYCEICGTNGLFECPECDKPIQSETARFCRFCGTPFQEES